MPLNYLHLKNQIGQMGLQARARDAELRSALEQLAARLNKRATDIIFLQELVEKAATQNPGLRCAVPVSEPLNTHIPVTLPAPTCTILAADGSQITPDPHDSVLYGLINIGIFRIQPGSNLVPTESTSSTLIFGDELYTDHRTRPEDLVNLLRDVREREMLAKLAAKESNPVITLTDGNLELFREPGGDPSLRPYFDKYLSALDDLAINDVVTAGYVSRPRANLVVNLLTLPGFDENETPANLVGLPDITLLAALLAPGERSAIFRMQSRSSAEYKDRKVLHFFYLNVGSTLQPAFARVEIPLWVVEKPDQVQLLHGVLVEQARLSGADPYPYPLLRAHEIAVVKMEDRQQLTSMIETELLRQGFPPSRKSEKQIHKDILGKRRRF